MRLVFALIAVALLTPEAAGQGETADVLLMKGDLAFQNRSYQEALDLYVQALDLNQSNAAAWTRKAFTLVQMEKYRDALDAFDGLLRVNRSNKEALNNKGVLHIHLGEYEEALSALNASLALDPQDEEALYNRGLALAKLRRSKEAADSFERVIQMNSTFLADAWSGKGAVLLDQGRNKEALLCFQNATGINPNLGRAWYGMGLALKGLDREVEAGGAFARAKGLGVG